MDQDSGDSRSEIEEEEEKEEEKEEEEGEMLRRRHFSLTSDLRYHRLLLLWPKASQENSTAFLCLSWEASEE